MGNETKSVNKISPVVKGYVIVQCFLYIVCFVCYCFGVTTYYGRQVGLYGAINMVLLVFELENIFYQNVVGIVLGVLYIIFFIKLISSFKDVFEYAMLVCKEKKDEDARLRYLLNLNVAFGERMKNILLFIVLCSWVKKYSIPFTGIIVIISFIVSYLFSRATLYSMMGYSNKSTGSQMGYASIFIMALVAIFLCLPDAYIENIFMDIQFSYNVLFVDFRGFILSVGNIVNSVLSISVLCFALECIGEVVESKDFQAVKERKSLEKFVYMAIAFFAVEIILLLVAGETPQLEFFISLLKKFIPLLCACISLRLITDAW